MAGLRYFILFLMLANCSTGSSTLDSKLQERAVLNLRTFSGKLLPQSEFNSAKFGKGTVISVPFGIGYTLTNINVLINKNHQYGPQQHFQNVVTDYSVLTKLLQDSNITTWSGVFLRPDDSSTQAIKLSEELKELKTEVRKLQLASRKEASKFNPAELPFTVSTLVHLNQYRAKWSKTWTDIGHKQFSDGASVPFLEVEDAFPSIERPQFTAVAVKLKDDKKKLVLVLPTQVSGNEISRDFEWVAEHPTENWHTNKIRKIQVPALNLTMSQPFWKFENVGIPARVCPDEVFDNTLKKWPSSSPEGFYFSGPIVQSNSFRLDSDGLDIESESVGAIYSEVKLNSTLAQNGGLQGFERYFHKYLNISLEQPIKNNRQRRKRSARLDESDKETLQFNRPFFWYLYDEKLGPLYYGAVESFESYQRETHVEPELQSLAKASLARASLCPQLFKSHN